MSATLRITLLGDFSLTYGDTPVAGVNAGRSQALMAYLLLHRQAPQPRQRLAFSLWPDSTDAQARANLRKELSYLRRDLPEAEQFLLVDGKTLQWSPMAPFNLDVADFEAAIQAAGQVEDPGVVRSHLERAVKLYRGDVLPDCEDEWLQPERERLQQMQLRALERLMQLLNDQQDYRTAIDYGQRLLRLDPYNESTYASLMRLYGLIGDRASGLQLYHRCMTMLREELGVDPSFTMRKLYEQLLEDDAPSSQTPTPSRPASAVVLSPSPAPLHPLIGREPEWTVLQNWWSAGNEGTVSEVLLLLGESGIGKTRLMEELRDSVQAAKGHVLWGRAFAAEMVRPYGVWVDGLRSLATSVPIPTELGVLLPEVGQAPSAPPDRSYLFDAVVQFLAQLTNDAGGLTIIFDDIQWMDDISSALLHYAIRLLGHLPVRFACTARNQELEDNAAIGRVVQALRRERRLRSLELKPLAREQMAELIRPIIHSTPEAREPSLDLNQMTELVFIDSGGNPLFALEVARALTQQETASSHSLEALICERLQQLPDTAAELIPWAAALGHNFSLTTVAQVADYPFPKLLTAVQQLEQQNIIRPSGSLGDDEGYDFVHDIVRQVAYGQLSEPRRRLVHRQIACILNQLAASTPSLTGDIAYHAALGGDRLLAATASLTAAEQCLKLFAYGEAAELARRGIQHCQALGQTLDDRRRIGLQLGLLRVCAIAGVTGDRAVQLEQDVQQLINAANALDLKDEEAIGLETLGILHFDQSNFTGLHEHMLRAVDVSRSVSPAKAAQMLAYSGSCLAEIGRDVTRAEALLLEAQSLAARVGLEICDIFSGLGCVQRHRGNYTEARSLLQQALHLTQAEQDHWRECAYLGYLAMIELEMDDPAAALPYCREMATVAAKMKGEGSEGAFAVALEALAHYRLGLSQTSKHLEMAIATLRQIDAKRMLSYVLIGAAEVEMQGNQAALAVERAELALTAAQTVNHPSEIALAWALGVQATLALGDREKAATKFEALYGKIDRYALSVRACIAVDCVTQVFERSSASGRVKRTVKNS